MSIFNLFKNRISLIFLIIALGLIYTCYEFRSRAYFALSIYIIVLVLYIIIKRIVLSYCDAKKYNSFKCTISVVMVVEGEDLESFINSIKSLLNQSYPLKEILIINSNSKNLNIYNTAKKIRRQIELFKESGIRGGIDLGDIRSFPDIIIKRITEIEGEKNPESWGITRSTGDLILACPNNISLENTKLEKIVKCFDEQSVSAIVGNMKLGTDRAYRWIKIFSKLKKEKSCVKSNLKLKICNIFLGDISLRCYKKEILLNNIKGKNKAL